MRKSIKKKRELEARYQSIFGDVARIIDAAKGSAARSVNAVMTATYWSIGQYIVEFEQLGEYRAEYGAALIERLANDLTKRFGRGFSERNLQQMRLFYIAYPSNQIHQTASGELESAMSSVIPQTPSAESSLASIASYFPLPWSAMMCY